MIITTTPTLENKKIKEYRGIVFGEVISGVNFVKDFMVGIKDFIGGRAEEFEKEIIDARAEAISEMVKRAEKVGANALVGVHIDIEPIKDSMVMVTATGTAVITE